MRNRSGQPDPEALSPEDLAAEIARVRVRLTLAPSPQLKKAFQRRLHELGKVMARRFPKKPD
jgi:hypothetical protein